jgi:hypothetical protein
VARGGVFALALALVVGLAGCADLFGHGCEPYGGEVAWHQPGTWEAALALANGSLSNVLPGPEPYGYALPEGDPVYGRFGDGARVHLRVGPVPGSASVEWAGNGTHQVHYGSDLDSAREAVRRLVALVAADPAESRSWAERHAEELAAGSSPIDLDLRLDVPRAFRTVEDAPAKATYSARHELADGDAVWTVASVYVTVQRGAEQAYVTAGDWVVAHVAGGNLTDPAVAGRRGAGVAQGVGLPAGPQAFIQVNEVQVCG